MWSDCHFLEIVKDDTAEKVCVNERERECERRRGVVYPDH